MSKLDVIIPTYKPGKGFLELIKRLQKQTYPVNKIIIMNTEEKYYNQLVYGTDFLEKNQNVAVYHHSKREFDHGRTRNSGVKRSNAEYILFMTQDALPVDQFLLERLVGALDEQGTAVAYARQLPAEECDKIERYTREFNYPENSVRKTLDSLPQMGIKTYFCSNVCALYHRKIFEELGGFVNHSIFNEDMIYAAGAVKAGYAVAYAADAKVIHSHNYTGMQQFHRNFDIGVSQADHPEIFAETPSESEGWKLVRQTARHLKQNGGKGLLPKLYYKSACKFIGFQLGKRYKSLPAGLINACTMNPDYWQQDFLKKAASGIDAARGYGKTEEERRK